MIMCIVQSGTLIKITMSQASPSLSIPMGLIYLALPVSFVLMILDFLSRIVLKKREGDK
jgi:TRAP-type C4-dicarboxylate transport system permease small subunit